LPLELCHRGYVFEIGRIALEASKDSPLKDKRIKEILMGA